MKVSNTMAGILNVYFSDVNPSADFQMKKHNFDFGILPTNLFENRIKFQFSTYTYSKKFKKMIFIYLMLISNACHHVLDK